MGSLQKVLLSLLISVVVAAGFSIVAFSGFFSYIESAFYDNRVERETTEQLSDINDALERYHQSIIERFSLFLEQPAVRNSFMVNQSREDILQRENLVGGLEEQLPELEYVRFVGLEDADLWFSSLESDIESREATRIVYAPASELEEPLPNRADLFGERPLFSQPDENAFVYTLPVVDNFGVERGRALFSVHVSGIRGYLIREDLIRANQQVAMLSGGRLLVNARRYFQEVTYDRIAEAIESQADYPTIATEGEDAFIVFTASGPYNIETGLLVSEDRFELSPLMQGVLLAAVFFTTLLLVHLLLNLRQDPAAVLSERVRRFQAEVIRELIREGGLQSRGLVQQQLERRREELDRRIKKGLGRVGKEKQEQLEEIVETNWKELGRLLGGSTTSQAQLEDVSLSKIEEIIDRTVRRYSLGAARAGGGTAAPAQPAPPQPVAPPPEQPSTEESSKRRPVEVEEVEEAEEIEEAEAVEEPEELGALEEAEEIEEAEAVEEPEELGALEEAEEVEEAEAVEEPEELGALEEAEEVDEAEAAEEVEELGTLEEAEEVEEAEAVEEEPEEVEEAEAVEEPEELGALEEAEEVEEAQAVEEEPEVVEEIVLEEDIISLEREVPEEEDSEEVEELEPEEGLEPLEPEGEVLEDVHAPEAPRTTPLEREEEELSETAQAVPFEVGKPETYGEMTPLEAIEAREFVSQEEAAEEILEEVGEVGEETTEELEEIEELSEEGGEESLEEVAALEEAPRELEAPTEVEEAESLEEVEELSDLEDVAQAEEVLPADEAGPEAPEPLPEEAEEEVAEYLEEPEEGAEVEEAEVEPAQHRPGSVFFSGFSFGERFSAASASSIPSPGKAPSGEPERKPEVEVIRGLEYVRIEPGTPSNAYELVGYEDLLEVLFAQNTVIREEEGLAEIEGAAYSHAEGRTALDRRFRGLVNDVLHKYSDSVGVSQLFGGIDALFVDEEEHREGEAETEEAGPSPMGARRIHDAFTRRGFDLDRFLRRRGDTTGRLYRTLIELTRTWRARTCALLQHTEGGFRAAVTLGLEDPWRDALDLDDDSNLAREVLLRRMVLQTRLPLNRFVDFATTIRHGEVSGVQQAFFIPARYNNTDAYLMVGYDTNIPSIENFVTRFINAAPNR